MAKYMCHINYTPEGAKGLRRDGGTKRREVAELTAKSLGGRLEAFYFAFGKSDVVCIADMPDAASMAALSLAVSETGSAEVVTTALLTVEEMDHAVSKHTAYRKPGG